ncbi:unnamed protein product [Protopolystoma xenopodis]|uniref:Uncharacterized protein n=1 Tax=Protopolystoma xenopodis TaxID=117903 RepID=A0A448XDU4_9PLAT|nr:unnamed protein product [Protopolystoma xenopodis]
MNPHRVSLSPKHIITYETFVEARKRCIARSQAKVTGFLNDLTSSTSNCVLDSLPKTICYPLQNFLIRLLPGEQLGRFKEANIEQALMERLSCLLDPLTQHDTSVRTKGVRVDILTFFRRAIQEAEHTEAVTGFIARNVESFNRSISFCLNSESREVIEEACYTLCVVARILRFQMVPGLEELMAGLIRVVALLMVPWETYVEGYREAKERHTDLEIARAQTLPFHFPRVEFLYHEVGHRTLAVLYYTLADLLFACPSPRLLNFFECRIFRRKEMTRHLLFNILRAVVINLTDLQEEAEALQQKQAGRQDGQVSSSGRHRASSTKQWRRLPAYMYADCLRVFHDRNKANKSLIVDILSGLRNLAPERLPRYEDAILKAMEAFSGSAGGGSGGGSGCAIGGGGSGLGGVGGPGGGGGSMTGGGGLSLSQSTMFVETYQIGSTKQTLSQTTCTAQSGLFKKTPGQNVGVVEKPSDQQKFEGSTEAIMGELSKRSQGELGNTLGDIDSKAGGLSALTSGSKGSLFPSLIGVSEVTSPTVPVVEPQHSSETADSSSQSLSLSAKGKFNAKDLSRRSIIIPKVPELFNSPLGKRRIGRQ